MREIKKGESERETGLGRSKKERIERGKKDMEEQEEVRRMGREELGGGRESEGEEEREGGARAREKRKKRGRGSNGERVKESKVIVEVFVGMQWVAVYISPLFTISKNMKVSSITCPGLLSSERQLELWATSRFQVVLHGSHEELAIGTNCRKCENIHR